MASDARGSTQEAETPKARRLLSLDALRGIAVLLMIEQHLGVWLWRGPEGGKSMFDYPGLLTFNALGGGAAPLFVTLAGIGSALMAAAYLDRDRQPDRTMVLRGLAVMGFGYLLSLLTPSWFTWRTWFVLHLMGFGMVLGPLWRRIPTWLLICVAASLLVATPFVQRWLETPASLHNPRMAGWLSKARGEVLPWAALRIAVAEGQFPIFPWLAFFVGGVAAGRWIREDRPGRVAIFGGAALALGGLFAVGYHVLKIPFMVANWRTFRVPVPFFPASPTFVLLLLGVVCIAVAVAVRIERGRELSPRGPLVALGRSSLTLLLLHVVMFREWTRPIGMWQALGATESLVVLLTFTVVAAFAARAWQRVDYRYGAEWLLRKVA